MSIHADNENRKAGRNIREKPQQSARSATRKPPTPRVAKKILRDKSIRGKKLTKKQKGLFGLIAGGGTPTRRRK